MTTKSRSRKAPIKHRELYVKWLRKTKWESKAKTHEIREMGKYARHQFPALLGLINFVTALIDNASFTDHRADPRIQFKIVQIGVFADFLNHSEEWVNNCLLIKCKLPTCNRLPAMKKAISQAAKHGLGISTVVDAINSSLSRGRKRKRAEAEGSGSDQGSDDDDEDDNNNNNDDNNNMAVDDVLATLEGEDWVHDEDENEASSAMEDDVNLSEWYGIGS